LSLRPQPSQAKSLAPLADVELQTEPQQTILNPCSDREPARTALRPGRMPRKGPQSSPGQAALDELLSALRQAEKYLGQPAQRAAVEVSPEAVVGLTSGSILINRLVLQSARQVGRTHGRALG
jgi:hypothetical protein